MQVPFIYETLPDRHDRLREIHEHGRVDRAV